MQAILICFKSFYSIVPYAYQCHVAFENDFNIGDCNKEANNTCMILCQSRLVLKLGLIIIC